MLYLNVGRVMNLRGILKRVAFLYKNGFIRTSAVNIANNQTWQIKFSNLEKLCLLLNCTPNDLFQWQPDENQTVTENTALKALMRDEIQTELSQIIKDMPLEKVEKVGAMLKQIKDEE
jgi:DNA-binding Xre family transcriptional regulator